MSYSFSVLLTISSFAAVDSNFHQIMSKGHSCFILKEGAKVRSRYFKA